MRAILSRDCINVFDEDSKMNESPEQALAAPHFNRRRFIQTLIAGASTSLVSLAQAQNFSNGSQQAFRPVRVTGGLVAGTLSTTEGVAAYLGIPYAAPPVGQLRWKPPQPVIPWQGIRRAEQMTASPFTPPNYRSSVYFEPTTAMSEDCLMLNVWTPEAKPAKPLPVMVWIYGGDWTYGSSSNPLYWGNTLARHDVVVVSINYRLGALGFFAHPSLSAESEHGVSGNYGLLDQIAALQWVQKNISHFGGDPDNVTVFGQSAGSFSVNYLMTSPLAKGLFHRAIGQSGAAMSGFGPLARLESLATQETNGVAFAKMLKANSLDDLRALPAQSLVNTGAASQSFCPVVDGWILPDKPHAIFAAGKQHRVPLLVGFNKNEGSVFPPLGNGTVEGLSNILKDLYGEQAIVAEKLYPATNTVEAQKQGHALFGDQALKVGTLNWATMHRHSSNQPVYLYHFAHKPDLPPNHRYLEGKAKDLGVFHGAEIPYAMGTLKASGWTIHPADKALSARMLASWVHFAQTGRPQASEAVWPIFDPDHPTVMEFGTQTDRLITLPRSQELALINQVANTAPNPSR
jgi:para-nitrobenzyl esterase